MAGFSAGRWAQALEEAAASLDAVLGVSGSGDEAAEYLGAVADGVRGLPLRSLPRSALVRRLGGILPPGDAEGGARTAAALARRMVLLLAGRDCLNRLDEVVEALRIRRDGSLGAAEARVETPVPLGEDEKVRLAAALARRLGLTTIRLKEILNPALQAGWRVQVGWTVFDQTIPGRQDLLARHLGSRK